MNKTDTSKCWRGPRGPGTPSGALETQTAVTWKGDLAGSSTVSRSATPFLRIYPREMDAGVHRRPGIWMLTVALFISNHTKRKIVTQISPSGEEGMDTPWNTSQQWKGVNCRHSGHQDAPPAHYAEWKNPDAKATYCVIPFICHPRKCKVMLTDRKQDRGFRGRDERERGMSGSGREPFGVLGCVHCLDSETASQV